MKPICQVGRRLTVCPFRKALECVGERGVVEWGGKPGVREGAGAKHREDSFAFTDGALEVVSHFA